MSPEPEGVREAEDGHVEGTTDVETSAQHENNQHNEEVTEVPIDHTNDAPPSTTSQQTAPIPVEAPTAPVSLRSGEDGVFRFHKIRDVVKVHRPGFSLDYWAFDVTLETDDQAYWEPPTITGLQNISTARRYSEFEWLREELVRCFPGAIVPKLPGLKMEGMLDKVKSLLMPPDDKEPPIVVFRKRGLTLFMEWIQSSPMLRTAPIMRGFVKTAPQEFDDFKKQWKDTRKKDPSLFDSKVDAVKYGALKYRGGELPQDIADAKVLAEQMAKEMVALKESIESLWDLQYSTKQNMRLPYPHYKIDPVTTALTDAGNSMTQALRVKHHTDVAYAKLLVWLSFYEGINHAVVDGSKQIERLSAMCIAAQQANHPNMERLESALHRATEVFRTDLQHWHNFRRMLCRRFPKKFTWLICHLDPTLFDWHGNFDDVLESLEAAYNVSLEEDTKHAEAMGGLLGGYGGAAPAQQASSSPAAAKDFLTYIEDGEDGL